MEYTKTKTAKYYDCFSSTEEAELYYSLYEFLEKAGVLTDYSQTVLLHRYCRMYSHYLQRLKDKPEDWQIEKMIAHLGQLEEQLCLTPKSMQEFKKNEILMQAKQQKIKDKTV